VTLQILLTNDDGIFSPGIAVLRRALEGLGEVTTIAPDHDSSAVARAITLERGLRVCAASFGGGYEGLACDGTPSDCVRVGLLGIRAPVPALVISGVNMGSNMGADITYSGTVGAAFEGALRGLPAIAFSVEHFEPRWLDEAVPVFRALVEEVIARGLPRHSVLNVNLPDRPLAEMAGIRPARLGGASCHDRVLLHENGAGPASPAGDDGLRPPALTAAAGSLDGVREYYVPCEEPTAAEWAGTDFAAVADGYVAVTPLQYHLLDAELLSQLSNWNLDLDQARA